MAAFLEQAAVGRMMPFQDVERCQRIGDAVQVALADRNHVEQIAVLGYFPQQCLARAQHLRELAAVEVRAHAQQFCLDARGRRLMVAACIRPIGEGRRAPRKKRASLPALGLERTGAVRRRSDHPVSQNL